MVDCKERKLSRHFPRKREKWEETFGCGKHCASFPTQVLLAGVLLRANKQVDIRLQYLIIDVRETIISSKTDFFIKLHIFFIYMRFTHVCEFLYRHHIKFIVHRSG